MGMDFDVRRLTNKVFPLNQYEYEELLYLRKPYHLAECCYMVANNYTIQESEEYYGMNIPNFGPWCFTNEQLKQVLELAYFLETQIKVEWSNDGSRREEYIEKWDKLIKDTEDDWVIIEWY